MTHRYERWMPTIVATNLTDEQIKNPLDYGPALLSRLLDTARSRYLVVTGRDCRSDVGPRLGLH